MQLFFEADFTINGNSLTGDESNHCVKVLRHEKGDIVNVINGKGSLFECRVVSTSLKQCKLAIINERYEAPAPFTCHVAIAPTKNLQRFEWFLEKGTEIGIKTITPVICRFSERKLIKPERLYKIIMSATKQSLSFWQPVLNPMVSFDEFISYPSRGGNYLKFIAHCREGEKKHLKDAYKAGKSAIILIGPEGDFDTLEITKAIESGFAPISLGNQRLRTETAALAAGLTIKLLND